MPPISATSDSVKAFTFPFVVPRPEWPTLRRTPAPTHPMFAHLLPRALILLAVLPFAALGAPAVPGFRPGTLWLDTHGKPINAHGGGVLFHDGRYYWYGEHKLPGRSEAQGAGGGVHCYSSANLVDWDDEGVVLPVDRENPKSEIALGCILERPKVLFNPRTRKFVLFFKLYPPRKGYEFGYLGVATADTPRGPFRYSHRFLGADSPYGSGDFVLVADERGIMHHLAVRKPDKVFVAGPLTDDYLRPAGPYVPVQGITSHTEAPAVMRVGGLYYLIGSGSSGWSPNAARSFVASALTGPYRELGNPARGVNPHNRLGPEKTFGGQISFLLPVPGRPEAFIALFDLWKPERAADGLYAWLPVSIAAGRPLIEWRDEWTLDSLTPTPAPH